MGLNIPELSPHQVRGLGFDEKNLCLAEYKYIDRTLKKPVTSDKQTLDKRQAYIMWKTNVVFK